MPKAILELEMPESCRGGCPFYKITDICDILSAWNNHMPVLVPSEGKHPDCPLKMDDKFQADYLISAATKKIIINLPEEAWKNIDTIIITRELVVEKQKEIEVEEE